MVSPLISPWHGYLSEARKFWQVAQSLDAASYPSQVVSNAVYAVIAATDALGVQRIGKFAGDHSHAEIVSLLIRACNGTPLEAELPHRMEQLRRVLQHAPSAHAGETVDPRLARDIIDAAAGFMAWVEGALPEAMG